MTHPPGGSGSGSNGGQTGPGRNVDFSMHNGQPMISIALLGLLAGVTEEEANAEFERQALERGHRNAFTIPPAWKRGAKEIQARYGTNDASVLIPLLRAEATR